MSEILDDGFGNQWLSCNHPKCDLQIVRPGKVQCSEWCDELSMDDLLQPMFTYEPMTSKPGVPKKRSTLDGT